MRIAVLLLSILFFSCSSTQTSAEKEAQLAEMNTLVNSGNFNFQAYRAVATKMGPIELTNNYNYLRFKNDSVIAELPFFGERYSGTTYGERRSGGINFEGIPENLEIVKSDKKNRLKINFNISDDQERFNVMIYVFPNKSMTVDVTSSQRSYISYRGEVEALKEKS